MGKQILFGIVENTENFDSLLNNLLETDVEEKDVSVIAKDQKLSEKYVDSSGPLKGINFDKLKINLSHLQVPNDIISYYLDSLEKGALLVAISLDLGGIDDLKELLQGYNVQMVYVTSNK